MRSKLHIIASCTDKKLRPVPPRRRLRAISAPSLKERGKRWCSALQAAEETEYVEAEGLYAGHHWTVVRELRGIAQGRGWQPEMWVASAGYGLVSFDTRIASYSATFANAAEDSVSPSGTDHDSEWWALLNEQSPAALEGRSSVGQLARKEPESTVLVIASPAYIWAMREDLVAAAKALQEPDQLIIFSSGAAATGTLVDNVVPSTAVLLQRFGGGTRLSLHARAARYALKTTGLELTAKSVKRRLVDLALKTEAPVAPNRTPMEDDDVRRFLHHVWNTEPTISCSRALRRLRDGGLACEQKRFKRLFEATRGNHARH